ncbi:MAG TPA: hypothetical protein VIJ29_03865 [Candidatus Paceibacterota bacterium]
MEPNLQKATQSLLRIHKLGGQDTEFLNEFRKDVDTLIRFLAFSFLLKEPGQKIDLPREWMLSVTEYCSVHQTTFYRETFKPALLLQRFEVVSTNINRSGKTLTSAVELRSCKKTAAVHNSREELFEFADLIASGWLDEVADQLAAFRLENVDWGALKFFAGKD